MTETLARDRSTWRALLEARDLPLESLDFDERADTVIVALDGRTAGAGVVLRHLVEHPLRLDVLEQPHGSLVLRIVGASGAQTLLTCRPVT